jgi:hypothetical protein
LWVEIIFARFIDDAKLLALRGVRIRKHRINLPAFERDLVALVSALIYLPQYAPTVQMVYRRVPRRTQITCQRIRAIAMVRNLKLESLMPIGLFVRESDSALSNEEIAKVAQSYDANMSRVAALFRTLPNIVRWTGIFQHCFHRSCMAVYNTVEPPPERNAEDRRTEVFQDFLNQYINERNSDPSIATKEEWEYCIPNLQSLCLHAPDPIFIGLEAVLESSIIQAWTAFEDMAPDLWVALVNEHPKDLSRLAGKWETPKNPEPEQKKVIKQDPRSISLGTLAEHNFDVSKVMGRILVGRQHFQSLDGIRSAFEQALGQYCEGIKKALHDDSLRHLSAVRNVLVHSAGIVDDKFTEQIARSPHFPNPTAGNRIELNGEIVHDIISRVVEQARAIFRSADKLLLAK